jgi:cephalosporin hydroxylase
MMNLDRSSSEGQLSRLERECLYRTVIRVHPQVVYEVGTWLGGGSTYCIASAMNDIGKGGCLVTCEIDKSRYEHAVKLYLDGELSYLQDNVKFLLGDAADVFRDMPRPDMVFLDGAEDPHETMNQYFMFDRMGVSVMAVHDWDSHKTDRIRGLLENYWLLVRSADSLRIFKRKKI